MVRPTRALPSADVVRSALAALLTARVVWPLRRPTLRAGVVRPVAGPTSVLVPSRAALASALVAGAAFCVEPALTTVRTSVRARTAAMCPLRVCFGALEGSFRGLRVAVAAADRQADQCSDRERSESGGRGLS